MVAGVAGGYQWRVVPRVPAGGAYPIGYQEVETVLVHATTPGLKMAISVSFSPNRGRMIRQVSGQTGDFLHEAVEECPNIEIADQLSLMNWISLLPSWAPDTNKPSRIQVIRACAGGQGPPDTLPPAGGAFHYTNPQNCFGPQLLGA